MPVTCRSLSPAPVLAGMIDDELTLSDEPVDIGQLQPVLVDAVEKGVALEDELLGRRRGRVAPRIERRQVGVFGTVLPRHADVQLPSSSWPCTASTSSSSLSSSWYFSWNCFMIVRRQHAG